MGTLIIIFIVAIVILFSTLAIDAANSDVFSLGAFAFIVVLSGITAVATLLIMAYKC